ncbi:MAG: hypothetical protein IKQ53_06700 [Bacteroidales bacterium]|nr:hypothetical protein [Bacteroidales bacterium]
MKRIALFIALTLATVTAAFCQQASFTTDGNTYRPAQSVNRNVPQKDSTVSVTPYSYELKDGSKLPIHIGKTGSCYIVRVSKKTGKEYRQYLGEEISRDICNKMGRQYTAKKKSNHQK